MSAYQAPLRDFQFLLKELVDFDSLVKLPGYEEVADIADAVLEEAGNFASSLLDPLNVVGDREGCKFIDGEVKTPKGFKEAYHTFADAGWVGLATEPEFGGQGLPQLLSTATLEIWNASNMGFALGPLLNQGAIEAILLCGTEEQKKLYVPNLVSGKWAGTMDLTEPNAGSDLAAVSTKAVPNGDHYLLTGQKIFITYGDHDITENIIHLTLARTPTAPPGIKGISLFITPKFLVNPDGSLGARNDIWCSGIEHKLGINASPTCSLNYGEKSGGAVGYLVGEENEGLKYMFVMMNLARFSVGVQGYAAADRAFQAALQYSKERVQSKDVGVKDPAPVAILAHPDIRRLLLDVKSQVEAARALAFYTAEAMDHSHLNPDPDKKAEAAAIVEFFTPIVKGWSTEIGPQLTSEALQVFGGSGYVEETGAAQYYRDVRICSIYEGTTAIQANDLLGRKFLRDSGKVAIKVIGLIGATAKQLEASSNPDVKAIGVELGKGVAALTQASMWLGANARADLRQTFAAAAPFLMLWGYVAGAWQLGRSALIAEKKLDDPFYAAKLVTARYYADHVLPKGLGYAHEVTAGGPTTMGLKDEQFDLDRKSLALA
ncbi:MAG: acyl-CoA dehydrogenase C-terminal domain-containing protein [Candidatus Baltobacteraceae bacterium]|jgi:alkylation response protein AidB-like acyl-CoA dehydrogenase